MNNLSSDERTSILLREILTDLPKSEIQVDYVLKKLHRRSFGGVLIMLAAISLVPGISIVAGLIIIVVGLQMSVGFRRPLFPKFIRQRQLDINVLIKLGEKAVWIIEKIERYVKPRWLYLTNPLMTSLIGIITIGLALVVMLPLPFSNLPPAIALLIISIGLLGRDGLMILVGMVVAIIALTIGVFIANFAIESFMLFLDKHYF